MTATWVTTTALPAYRVTLHATRIGAGEQQIAFTVPGHCAHATFRPRRTHDHLVSPRAKLLNDRRVDAILDRDLCRMARMRVERARKVLDGEVGGVDGFLEVQPEHGVSQEEIQ